MPLRTVEVTCPDWVWGRLASIADHQKITVSEVVVSALMRELEADPYRKEQLVAAMTGTKAATIARRNKIKEQ